MTTAEISFDLVMAADMAFVEGTYRLPGGEWQVFIFSKRPMSSPQVSRVTWGSGVSGIHVACPIDMPLDQSVVERLMSGAAEVDHWQQVRGPDSMQLR